MKDKSKAIKKRGKDMIYENNWESLNSRPVPEWFADAKFGIFIHFGLYSVPAFTKNGNYAEWYMWQLLHDKSPEVVDFHRRTYGENFSYEDFVGKFKCELFDPDKWAEIMQASGARYMNITSKHHDGYCLWKTDYAWNWNSVDIGPHIDFLGELKKSLAKTDVRFGVYHSLYEWYNPLYLKNPEQYALEHLHPMLKEIMTKYEPSTLFTDGEWDQTYETWHSTEFLSWLYNESPVKDYIVPNDRWGKGTRGRLGGNFTTEYGLLFAEGSSIDDVELDRPFEECRGIGKSFGFNRIEGVDDYMSAKELIELLCSLVSKGGNFLLNIGPAADGTIPVIMEERLRQIGKWLSVNGEAIYATRVYTKKETPGVYYTKSKDGKKIYATLSKYPFGDVTLTEVPYSPELKARLFACDAPVKVSDDNGKVRLSFPAISPDDMKCEYLYSIELSE